MKRLVWSRVGVVLLLVIVVAAVLQLKQQQDASSVSATSAPVSDRAIGVPRMLDLGSTTCIPCKMMVPVMDELKKAYAGKLQVDFINVTEDQESARKYGIDTIPSQIFFDASGRELYRHIGFYPKNDIIAKFRELGIRL